MQVTAEDNDLFYKLYPAILGYTNRKLGIVPEQFSGISEYAPLPPQSKVKVRDALYAHREILDQFVAENPAGLSAEELALVAGWKHALVGKFLVFRSLKNHTLLLGFGESPQKVYGVLGLTEPIERAVNRPLPVLCNTVLLPFKGQIIYDGLITSHSIVFGSGIRRGFNEDYNRAKAAFGIITSLSEGTQPPPPPKQPRKPSPSKTRSQSSSTEIKDILGTLIEMTDAFCKEFLNDEYAELCRKLATALARKRPSPLLQGKLETWACGVVRTIGWVNYLDDRSRKPHLKLPFIDKAFGVAESTGQGKSKLIRKMFKIRNFDPKWTLPSRMDDNPLVWMLSVNGFLMDIRNAPREAQVVAFEKGLIPYIPADRAETSEED